MIKKIIAKIAIYSLLVYLTVQYGANFEFIPFYITTSALTDLVVYLILWAILWVVYNIIRKIIKTLTLPLNRFTIGLFGVFLNIVTIYGFAEAVNLANIGINIQTGTVIEIVIFSLIIRVIDRVF